MKLQLLTSFALLAAAPSAFAEPDVLPYSEDAATLNSSSGDLFGDSTDDDALFYPSSEDAPIVPFLRGAAAPCSSLKRDVCRDHQRNNRGCQYDLVRGVCIPDSIMFNKCDQLKRRQCRREPGCTYNSRRHICNRDSIAEE
mmetsp:Transcript_36512/g.77849  ORF Transcript_36512/g.77849 Transcript_36512/m.77849 type:complete len:141 (-) Transcript_36512:325-747(-)